MIPTAKSWPSYLVRHVPCLASESHMSFMCQMEYKQRHEGLFRAGPFWLAVGRSHLRGLCEYTGMGLVWRVAAIDQNHPLCILLVVAVKLNWPQLHCWWKAVFLLLCEKSAALCERSSHILTFIGCIKEIYCSWLPFPLVSTLDFSEATLNPSLGVTWGVFSFAVIRADYKSYAWPQWCHPLT